MHEKVNPEIQSRHYESRYQVVSEQAVAQSAQAFESVTSDLLMESIVQPSHVDHGAGHYRRVEQRFSASMRYVPQMFQMPGDEDFNNMFVGGCIACRTHDHHQILTDIKPYHGPIQAIKTYLDLHDNKEKLGLTDEQIYIAAVCTYYHSSDQVVEAASSDFQLPPLEEIATQVFTRTRNVLSPDEIWPDRDTYMQKIKKGYPPYPFVDGAKLDLVARRMSLADEFDAYHPLFPSIVRLCTTYPDRPLFISNSTKVLELDLGQRLELGGSNKAPDDISRFLTEIYQSSMLRETYGAQAYETSLFYSAIRHRVKRMLKVVRSLAGGNLDFVSDEYRKIRRNSTLNSDRLNYLAEEENWVGQIFALKAKTINPDDVTRIENLFGSLINNLSFYAVPYGLTEIEYQNNIYTAV